MIKSTLSVPDTPFSQVFAQPYVCPEMSNYYFNIFAVDCRVNWKQQRMQLNHLTIRKQPCLLRWKFKLI